MMTPDEQRAHDKLVKWKAHKDAREADPLKPHKDRLAWDFEHLWDSDINPYVSAGEGDSKPKNRTGMEDVTHAVKNVVVSWWRLKRTGNPEKRT